MIAYNSDIFKIILKCKGDFSLESPFKHISFAYGSFGR